MTSTDLRQCVDLLTTLLDDHNTDGLGLTKQRSRSAAAKTRKKTTHSHTRVRPKGGSARHGNKKRGVPMRLGRRDHHGSVQSLSTPYNNRLASSTPNTTLLQASNPTAGRTRPRQPAPRTKRNPDWPLVLRNLSYSLTSGQSNALNSSSQVNFVQPPSPEESKPRLFRGHVDFRPNPGSWFNTQYFNHVKVGNPGNTGVPVSVGNIGVSSQPVATDSLNMKIGSSELTDVNVAERESSAVDPAFSLYSASTNPTTIHSMPTSQIGTSNHGKGLKQPVLTMENPRFREAILSLKAALKEEAVRTGMNKVDRIRANQRSSSSSTRTLPKKSHVKRASSTSESIPSCTRCAKRDHARQKKADSTKENTPPKQKQQPVRKPSEPAKKKILDEVPTSKSVQFSDRSPEILRTPRESDVSGSLSTSMQHMDTLKRLIASLRGLASSERDVDIESLATQIEQTAAMFVPGLGGLDWQTEMELAKQPLRMENAELRRKLRIANQHAKDKTSTSDQDYQTVHLSLQKSSLEQELREARCSLDRERDRAHALQTEANQLRAEKQTYTTIIADKDADQRQSVQSLTSDLHRHRAQSDDAQSARERAERALQQSERAHSATCREMELLMAAAEHREAEVTALNSDAQRKDAEIHRLKDLVKSLRSSMSRLLASLQGLSPPPPEITTGRENPQLGARYERAKGKGQKVTQQGLDTDIRDMKNLLHSTEGPADVLADDLTPRSRPPADHTSEEGLSAARRSLPFSNKKRQKTREVQSSTKVAQMKPLTGSPVDLNLTSSPKQKTAESDEELDTTDYLLAPGFSPIKLKTMKPSWKKSPGNSTPEENPPTVKDLLTPLADRLKDQYKRLSLGGSSGGASKQTQVKSGLNAADVNESANSTMVESGIEDLPNVETVNDQSQRNFAEMSRYSMTDYFKKYSTEPGRSMHQGRVPAPETSHLSTPPIHEEPDPTDGQLSQHTDLESVIHTHNGGYQDGEPAAVNSDLLMTQNQKYSSETPHFTEANLFTSRSQDRLSGLQTSLQESLYKGTVLDASISTIDDVMSLASLPSTVALSSVSSVGTLDDSAFRQGLADLDANIAKMQEQLKSSLGSR